MPGAEWLALLCKHIPDRYEHLVRYLGRYSNRARGERAKEASPHAGAALPAPSEQPTTEFAARTQAILNASSGMNNTTKNKLKQFMLSGEFSTGFTTGLMAKDVRTALEVAEAMHGPGRMARHAAAIWNDAEKTLGATSDHTAIFTFLENNPSVPVAENQ